jgi:hypothetical protein
MGISVMHYQLDCGEKDANTRHTTRVQAAIVRHAHHEMTLPEYVAEIEQADIEHTNLIGDMIRLVLRAL